MLTLLLQDLARRNPVSHSADVSGLSVRVADRVGEQARHVD